MKKLLSIILAGFIFMPLSCSRAKKEGKVQTEKTEVKYHCPMHPDYVSDKPGECPICGMTLVPIKKEEGKMEHQPPGTVSISPYKEQIIGVKVWKVKTLDLTKTIRTVGRVVPDERLVYHIHLKFDGWIKEVFADYEGILVRRGDPLFSVYSEILLSSQEEFLIALDAYRKAVRGGDPEVIRTAKALLDSAGERLLLFGMTNSQIETLKRTKNPMINVTIYSPYSGYVLKKNIVDGIYVTEGTHIYEIADLSKVWVIADIYESEVPFVEVGDKVTVSSPYIPGLKKEGTISYLYPYLHEKTRTIRARVELNNEDLSFKPGMYVDVTLTVPVGERIAVPIDAVMRTGKRDIVFVKIGEGKYAPREVKIGPPVDNYYPVFDGLKEGEEVVVSANFLIDSESKLKLAIEAMGGESPAGEHGGH